MTTLHTLDIGATATFKNFQAMVDVRLSTPVEKAGQSPREFEEAVIEAAMGVAAEVIKKDVERHDLDTEGIIVGERSYRRKHRAKKVYMTSAGKIEVERTVYVERGGHGGGAVVPLEKRLGLVDGYWTQRAAEVGCRYMEAGTSKKSAELLRQHKGMKPSASHLDRLPKVFSKVWEAEREAIGATIRKAERLPEGEEVATIMVSVDGIMLRMKDAPYSKETSGPKGHREVACGTVSLFDREGKRLNTVKIGRMPESKKVSLCEELSRELKELKERYPKAKWQAVSDGAKENWRIFGDLSLDVGVKMEKTLDFWHAIEHLTEALRLSFRSDTAGLQAEIKEWREVLKANCHGPGKLIRRLEELLPTIAGAKEKKEFDRELNYFRKNRAAGRMRWAKLGANNQPIGSGVQEAACKTLVTERMKCSGMSWLSEGGQAILTLRGLQQSGRMDAAWEALEPYFCEEINIDLNPRRKRPRYRLAA